MRTDQVGHASGQTAGVSKRRCCERSDGDAIVSRFTTMRCNAMQCRAVRCNTIRVQENCWSVLLDGIAKQSMWRAFGIIRTPTQRWERGKASIFSATLALAPTLSRAQTAQAALLSYPELNFTSIMLLFHLILSIL